MMCDILIIEDQTDLGKLLKDFLKAEGYSIQLCSTGEAGLAYVAQHDVKLIILDIMMPHMDGFSVCQHIRQTRNTPILIVSARTSKEDQLKGLLLGADDYIEKPYDIDLLVAKIKGIFERRYHQNTLELHGLKLDKQKRLVWRYDTPLQLSLKEFELLQYLMENAGKALSKDAIFYKVWGFDSASEPQTLTVHIKWLREKIEQDCKHPNIIQTVWGVGYRFEE